MQRLSRVFKLMTLMLGIAVFTAGCPIGTKDKGSQREGRIVMFIGMDISGSFVRSKWFDDSIRFMAHYIYYHLNGLGSAETPKALFVGSIGGAKPNEPKTFFPIQTFEHRSVSEIEAQLRKIFPKNKQNPLTDYSAFFEQIAVTARNRNLILKPIDIIMLTDGVPDSPMKGGMHDYRSINLQILENLARKITLRVLYTSATVGINWQTKVPRQKVRVWTQDANVMGGWKDKHIMIPGKKLPDQKRFFQFITENVDFPVQARRVN